MRLSYEKENIEQIIGALENLPLRTTVAAQIIRFLMESGKQVVEEEKDEAPNKDDEFRDKVIEEHNKVMNS